MKEVFKFKVHFRVTRRNTRWIQFEKPSEVNIQNAKQMATQWISDKNKVTYGTYTYIEHDIGKKAFRAHFKAMEANAVREPRWVAINDCATLKQAEEFA